MRKHRGTPYQRDKHLTLAVISPPGVARGRFVGDHQSGLAGCKPPSLFMRGASSCSSQGRRQGEPWGASPRLSAPTYLPTSFPSAEGGVEPVASDSEVGCYLLWCRVRPRFRRQGCCLGGRELWVWEV